MQTECHIGSDPSQLQRAANYNAKGGSVGSLQRGYRGCTGGAYKVFVWKPELLTRVFLSKPSKAVETCVPLYIVRLK